MVGVRNMENHGEIDKDEEIAPFSEGHTLVQFVNRPPEATTDRPAEIFCKDFSEKEIRILNEVPRIVSSPNLAPPHVEDALSIIQAPVPIITHPYRDAPIAKAKSSRMPDLDFESDFLSCNWEETQVDGFLAKQPTVRKQQRNRRQESISRRNDDSNMASEISFKGSEMEKSHNGEPNEYLRFPILQAFHHDFSLKYQNPAFSSFEEFSVSKSLEVEHTEQVDLRSLGKGTNYTRFLLDVNYFELSGGYGWIEPIYLEFAVYDIAGNNKLSESVWVLYDLRKSLEKVRILDSYESLIFSRSKSAIFTIPWSRRATFLICKIYRTYQGELQHSLDLYSSQNASKRYKPTDIPEDLELCLKKLGDFKQVFGWSMTPLFREEDGSPLPQELLKFSEIFAPPSSYESLGIEALCESVKRKLDNPKSISTLPGTLDVTITHLKSNRSEAIQSLVENDSCIIVDPMLREIFPRSPNSVSSMDSDKSGQPPKKIIREVLDYVGTLSNSWAFDELCHILYIYPKSISFPEHKDIAILVQVMDKDESITDESLPVIFGAPPSKALTSRFFTRVLHLQSPGQFDDEIKIKLPISLTFKHHVLFTFYSISVPRKKQIASSLEFSKVIGYSILPLYADGRLPDPHYELTIFTSLNRPPYLLVLSNPDKSHTLDPMKYRFSLRTRLVSSLYSNNPYLNRFLLNGLIDSKVLSVSITEFNEKKYHKGQLRQGFHDLQALKPLKGDDSRKNTVEIMTQVLMKNYRAGFLLKKGSNQSWSEKYLVLSNDKLRVCQSIFRTQSLKEYSTNPDVFSIMQTHEKDRELVIEVTCGSLESISFFGVPSKINEDGHDSDDERHSSTSGGSFRLSSDLKSASPSPSISLSTKSKSFRMDNTKRNTVSAGLLMKQQSNLRKKDRAEMLKVFKFTSDTILETQSWLNAFTHVKTRNFNAIDAIQSLLSVSDFELVRFSNLVIVRLFRVLTIRQFDLEQTVEILANKEDVDEVSNASLFVSKCQYLSFDSLLHVFSSISKHYLSSLEAKNPILKRVEKNPASSPLLLYLSKTLCLQLAKSLAVETFISPHEAVIDQWLYLLMNKDSNACSKTLQNSIRFAHTLFQFISSSMIYQVYQSEKKLRSPDQNLNLFPVSFTSKLVQLTALLLDEALSLSVGKTPDSRLLFVSIVNFIRELVYVLPREHLMTLLHEILARLLFKSENSSIELWVPFFLHSLSLHDQFFSLSSVMNVPESIFVFLDSIAFSPCVLSLNYSRCDHHNLLRLYSKAVSGSLFNHVSGVVSKSLLLSPSNQETLIHLFQFLETPIISFIKRRIRLSIPSVLIFSVMIQQLHSLNFQNSDALFSSLRHFLTSVDFDRRVHKSGARGVVSSAFLPLISFTLLEIESDRIRRIPFSTLKDLLVSVLFIIKSTSPNLLKDFIFNFWIVGRFWDSSVDVDDEEDFSEVVSKRLANYLETEPKKAEHHRYMSTCLGSLFDFLTLCISVFEYASFGSFLSKIPEISGENSPKFLEILRKQKPSKVGVLCVDSKLEKKSSLRWQKFFVHELSSVLLNLFKDVALPLVREHLVNNSLSTDFGFHLVRKKFLIFIISLFSVEQSSPFQTEALARLAELAFQYHDLLFAKGIYSDKESCLLWWDLVIKLLTSPFESVRQSVHRLILQLFELSYLKTGSIFRFKLYFMRAFLLRSRDLIETKQTSRLQFLISGLADLLYSSEKSLVSAAFRICISAMFRTLQEVMYLRTSRHSWLQKYILASKNIHNSELVCEDLIQIIYHRDLPLEIQLIIFTELRDLHLHLGNCIEASQCMLEITRLWRSSYSVGFLKHSASDFDDLYESFFEVSSTLELSDPPLPEIAIKHLKFFVTVLTSHYSTDGYPSSPMYFEKVARIQKKLISLRQQILQIESEQGKNRSMGNFFRVLFYGTVFGEMHGKSYIYRRPKYVTFSQMKDLLLSDYRGMIGADSKVQIISSSSKLDTSNFDPTLDFYIQVHPILPHFAHQSSDSALSRIERVLCTKKWIYVRTIKEGNYGTYSNPRTKHILETESSFPWINSRMKVIHSYESVTAPVDAAIEDFTDEIESIASLSNPSIGQPNFALLYLHLLTISDRLKNGVFDEIIYNFFDRSSHSSLIVYGVSFVPLPSIPSRNQLKKVLVKYFTQLEDALRVCRDLAEKEGEVQKAEELASSFTELKTKLKDQIEQ